MPKLYVMVALPRSGKSTYVQEHFSDTVKVSADQLRLLIYGKRFMFKGEAEVWRTREVMLKALMEQGLEIVIDETNVSKESRRVLIDLGKEYLYQSVAIVIKTDKEICKKRAIETNQVDLVPVIERMAKKYEEVTEKEGFQEIIIVDGNADDKVPLEGLKREHHEHLN